MTNPRRFPVLLLTGALIAAGLATPLAGQAGPRSTANALATAEIVNSLNVKADLPLAFGLLKGGSTNGAIRVEPRGVRVPVGGAEMVGSGPCHTVYCEDDTSNNNPQSAAYWGPGQFQVTGTPGASYRIDMQATATAYLRTPAAGRVPLLTVHSFTALAQSTGSATGILGPNGTDIVRIGGTIDLPAGMKTGSYRVNIPINVAYY